MSQAQPSNSEAESPDRPLRIGLWIAVSSKAQAEDDKVSLSHQEAQGRQFAEEVGGEVVAVYDVRGHSRDILFWSEAETSMPAYGRLRQDATNGNLDVLWVYDTDRLGRDPALAQQVISLVERSDAEVFTSTSPHMLGQKSVGHRYLDAIKAVRAGEDQAIRIQRHQAGMRGRVEKRGLLANNPPFYLDVVRGKTGEVIGYEFNEKAEALDLMTDLFLGGHSYGEMTRRLEASDFPPPGNGRCWWSHRVRMTMLSDVAAGYPSWGDFQAPEPSDRIPARWDQETHHAVLRERMRRQDKGYFQRNSSPLRGVVFCDRCGGTMGRHRVRETEYLCCSKNASRSLYPHLSCHGNHIPIPIILEALASQLERWTRPAVIDAFIDELGGGEKSRLTAALSAAEGEVADLEARRRRIGHALAKGDMDVALFREVDDDLLGRLDAGQKRAQDLERAVAAMPDLEQRRQALGGLAEQFRRALATQEAAAVSAMLQRAGIRVFVEDGVITRIGLA